MEFVRLCRNLLVEQTKPHTRTRTRTRTRTHAYAHAWNVLIVALGVCHSYSKEQPWEQQLSDYFQLKKLHVIVLTCFHMTSLPSYWCPKQWNDGHVGVTNQSCMVRIISLCKNVLFSKIHLHGCWPREWKGSITTFTKSATRKQSLLSFISMLLFTNSS